MPSILPDIDALLTPSSPVEIRTADQGGFFTAQVACPSINDHAAPEFQRQLIATAQRAQGNLAIALGGVGTMTSAGLSALVAVGQACAEAGGRCVLCDVPEDLQRILRTTRLDKSLPMVRDLDEARRLLSPHKKRGPLARLLGAA